MWSKIVKNQNNNPHNESPHTIFSIGIAYSNWFKYVYMCILFPFICFGFHGFLFCASVKKDVLWILEIWINLDPIVLWFLVLPSCLLRTFLCLLCSFVGSNIIILLCTCKVYIYIQNHMKEFPKKCKKQQIKYPRIFKNKRRLECIILFITLYIHNGTRKLLAGKGPERSWHCNWEKAN